MKNLSLFTLLIAAYGCNEKISPELNAGSSTTVPSVITPTTYYFELKNDSPTVLNYVMHRSGPGKQSTSCKISNTTGFSSENFIADVTGNAFDDRSYDITCFMEAEELALFFNGINYKIESSMNTCEYIAYTPYSYFDAIPGSSTASFRGIVCGSDAASPSAWDVGYYAYNNGLIYDDGDATNNYGLDLNNDGDYIDLGEDPDTGVDVIGCNQMIDTSAALADRVPQIVDDPEQSLCRYDYDTNGGGNGQNCDTGVLTFSITELYDADAEAAYDFETKAVSKPRHECGGSITACVQGAIKQESDLADMAFGTVIYATEANTDFSKAYDLPALIGERSATFDIVNYRKGLASLHLDYKDYDPTSDSYWGNTTYRSSFDPALMERFSNNRHPNNSTIIASGDAVLWGQQTYGHTATPLAADPFLGIGSRVSPFYNFLCLDRAYEIKARIRMVVRDWDRVFPSSNTSLSYITDVFESSINRRQDLPSVDEEVPGDGSVYIYFNDKDDWDNLIPMRRWRQDDVLLAWPHGVYTNASGIVWEPDHTTLSPDPGLPWFQSEFFPNQGPLN